MTLPISFSLVNWPDGSMSSDRPSTSSTPPGSVMLRALRICARRVSETPAAVSRSCE